MKYRRLYQAIRRPAGRLRRALRWRMARLRRWLVVRFGWRRVGSAPVANVVIHISLPPNTPNTTGRWLESVHGLLADRGVALVSPGELHRIGQSLWDPDATGLELDAGARGLRSAIAQLRARPPLSALVLSTGQALGSSPLSPAEATELRPGGEAMLARVVAAVRARRTTVLLDVPDAVGLCDAMIVERVVEGARPPAEIDLAPGLVGDLADRLRRVSGVDDVVVTVDDHSPWVPRILGALERAGVVIPRPEPLGRDVRPKIRWTLRTVLAAAAANPHVDGPEQRRVHQHLVAILGDDPVRSPAAVLAHPPVSLPARRHGAGKLPKIRRLHLHAGIQKTATTTIQRAMVAAREHLRDAGVVYVDRSDIMKKTERRAWGAYANSGSASFATFADDLQALVRRHQRRSLERGLPDDVVFISNETMVGALERGPFLERPFRRRSERALSQILDILQPDECHVTLTVRRQDTLLESTYMWQIHAGQSFDFTRYVEAAMRYPGAMSFQALADRVESLAGVDSVRVRPYEIVKWDVAGYLNDLLTPMGVTVDFDSIDFPRHTNAAYSQRALEIAKDANPLLSSRREIQPLREHLRETFPIGEYSPAMLLDSKTRQALIDMYADANRRLFRRSIPDLPEDAYCRLDTDQVIADALRAR
jgi:hypothetical protein